MKTNLRAPPVDLMYCCVQPVESVAVLSRARDLLSDSAGTKGASRLLGERERSPAAPWSRELPGSREAQGKVG